jgi:4-carboxymuconolactone decarboxylase
MNDRYAKGLAVRKEVLGSTQVEATVKAAESALNEGLQKYLTEFVWGDIWSRPGLSLRDRSLVTLGMLTALNRSVELKTHIRGALNNGLTMEEIAEVFLHGAAYCGFPAAMTSLRLAKEVAAGQTPTAAGQ